MLAHAMARVGDVIARRFADLGLRKADEAGRRRSGRLHVFCGFAATAGEA